MVLPVFLSSLSGRMMKSGSENGDTLNMQSWNAGNVIKAVTGELVIFIQKERPKI